MIIVSKILLNAQTCPISTETTNISITEIICRNFNSFFSERRCSNFKREIFKHSLWLKTWLRNSCEILLRRMTWDRIGDKLTGQHCLKVCLGTIKKHDMTWDNGNHRSHMTSLAQWVCFFSFFVMNVHKSIQPCVALSGFNGNIITVSTSVVSVTPELKCVSGVQLCKCQKQLCFLIQPLE